MLKGSAGLCFRKREKRGKYKEISRDICKGFFSLISFRENPKIKNKKTPIKCYYYT